MLKCKWQEQSMAYRTHSSSLCSLGPPWAPILDRFETAKLEAQKSFVAFKFYDAMILRTYGFGRIVSLLLAT